MDIETAIIDNSNLIYSVVKMFSNEENKEDLYQIGVVGMLKAYENYDYRENVKFTTYAYPYILGEIRKYLREDKNIKISRNISKFNYKIDQVRNILSQRLYREPTIKEIADFIGIDETIVSDSINSRKKIKSLDDVILNDSKEITLQDIIPSKKIEIDSLISLKEELNKLSQEEKELIKQRYFCDYTQSETASILGMSQVQVSRREKKILTKLKNNLR